MRIWFKRMGRIVFWLIVFVLSLGFLEITGTLSLLEPFRCWALRYSVLCALDNAKTIRVVEHSNRFDRAPGLDPAKETIYATITLSPKQVDELRTALPLSLSHDNSILKCIFEEHQRIEIVEPGGTVTTLHLCFHCGQLYLNENWATEGRMPPGWQTNLSHFISSIGLHPEGPWDQNPDAAK